MTSMRHDDDLRTELLDRLVVRAGGRVSQPLKEKWLMDALLRVGAFTLVASLLYACGGDPFGAGETMLDGASETSSRDVFTVEDSSPSPTADTGAQDVGDGHDAATANDADVGPAPEETGTHVMEPDAGRDAPTTVAPDAGLDVADSGAQPDVVTGGCSVGSVRCMGVQPQLCVAGAWEGAGPACTATPCIAGACAACVPGATQCAGGTQPQTCSQAGTWQDNGSPVTHSNGVGQSWTDCTPVGTIDEAEAMRACAAYAGSAGQCSASTNGCNWAIVQDNVNGYQWAYTGSYAGYVSTSGCSGFTGSTMHWN